MHSLTRRTFLGASAALSAGLDLADDKKSVSHNEKVTVALVGCGGMGRGDPADFMRLPDFECVGMCDPDPGQIKAAMDDLKKKDRPTEKVQTEQDFRRLLERKDLDCVIVGTPDHLHAYVL